MNELARRGSVTLQISAIRSQFRSRLGRCDVTGRAGFVSRALSRCQAQGQGVGCLFGCALHKRVLREQTLRLLCTATVLALRCTVANIAVTDAWKALLHVACLLP